MDISAAKKQPEKPQVLSKDLLNNKSYRIAVRINTTLYDTVLNYLSAMHNLSDYSYASISDVLRDILYRMEQKNYRFLFQIYKSNHKYTEIILRVTSQQKKFWQSLPDGSRRKIFEKGVLAFINDTLS